MKTRSALVLGLLAALMPPLLSACANSATGQALENSLAPDPRLTDGDRAAVAGSEPGDREASDPEAGDREAGDRETPDPSAPEESDPEASDPEASPSPDREDPAAPEAALPERGDLDGADPSPSPSPDGATTGAIADAPTELQPYLKDWATLGVLTLEPLSDRAAEGDAQTAARSRRTASDRLGWEPNTPIRRRDYARWLVAANNRLYRDRPAQQIRLADESAQPAFQDVPPSDPDYNAIQGLAEAGILPSPLTGDAAATAFRPEAAVTRETLVTWKVPLDLRQPLALATTDAIREAWGFQDAAKIDPRAARAVLADYQNGDLSNIRRAFGFSLLFQPQKPATKAEAAAALWFFGVQGQGISAADAIARSEAADRPAP